MLTRFRFAKVLRNFMKKSDLNELDRTWRRAVDMCAILVDLHRLVLAWPFDLLPPFYSKFQNYPKHTQINSNSLFNVLWCSEIGFNLLCLVVTLTFDILTSKSNKFISFPKCTECKAVYEILTYCFHTTEGRKDLRPENIAPPPSVVDRGIKYELLWLEAISLQVKRQG